MEERKGKVAPPALKVPPNSLKNASSRLEKKKSWRKKRNPTPRQAAKGF